jgi:hypothetical protein
MKNETHQVRIGFNRYLFEEVTADELDLVSNCRIYVELEHAALNCNYNLPSVSKAFFASSITSGKSKM